MSVDEGCSRGGAARTAAFALVLAAAASTGTAVPGAGTAAAATTTPFVPGSGIAIARSVSIGPHTAGVNFSFRFGKAAASYEDAGARAQAQTLDLGIIGIFLSTNQCGGPPALPPDQVPRPLEADSHAGHQHRSAHHASVGDIVDAGDEAVDATPAPDATADTTSARLSVGSVVELGGLTSHAHSGVLAAGREATAASQVGAMSLQGGLVQFRDLRWTVHHRTGAGATATGDFVSGTVIVRGAAIDASTPAGLDTALSLANATLAPTGVRLDAPRVVSHPDGSVEVTPLVVAVTRSAASGPLAAAVGAAQPARNRILDLLFGAGCYPRYLSGAALTVLDVLTAAIDGTGEGDIELGGVSAGTDATMYSSPFGFVPPPSPQGVSTTTVVPPTTTRVPGVAPRVSPSQPAQPTSTATRMTSAITRLCRSVHPSGQPACWLGAGPTAGAAAASVVLALLIADIVWSRRRRNRHEEVL